MPSSVNRNNFFYKNQITKAVFRHLGFLTKSYTRRLLVTVTNCRFSRKSKKKVQIWGPNVRIATGITSIATVCLPTLGYANMQVARSDVGRSTVYATV
jgi:hypothetical protein